MERRHFLLGAAVVPLLGDTPAAASSDSSPDRLAFRLGAAAMNASKYLIEDLTHRLISTIYENRGRRICRLFKCVLVNKDVPFGYYVTCSLQDKDYQEVEALLGPEGVEAVGRLSDMYDWCRGKAVRAGMVFREVILDDKKLSWKEKERICGYETCRVDWRITRFPWQN